MNWRLRDGLHYAVSGGTGVFLDVHEGRYFALPTDLDRALQALLEGSDATPALQVLADLEDFAILVRSQEDQSTCRAPQLPAREREGRGRVRLSLVLRAATELCRVRRDLRLRPLAEIGTCLARRPGPAASPSSVGFDRLDVAASVACLGEMLGTVDQCLPQTLALVRICRGAGLDVQAVIGVCAAPFAAHCWAQSGDILLNDRLERVAMFTPILAW